MPGNKVEREVEEILARDERKTGAPTRLPVARAAPPARRRYRLGPGMLMLAALAVAAAGLVIADNALPFVLAALALFSLGYFWSMQGRARGRQAQPAVAARRAASSDRGRDVFWRGERVDTIQPRRAPANVVQFKSDWRSRLRRFFRGRR